MAAVIVTRTKAEYLAALDSLKRDDLRTAQKAQREQAQAERKAAVEVIKRLVPEPKVISREEYLAKRQKKRKKKKRPTVPQRVPAVIASPTKPKAVGSPKKKKKKRKKKTKTQSVRVVSGGAFESNRRRH